MVETEQFRKQFPILKNKIQLSSCSQSAMHISVKEALQQYTDSLEHQGMNWMQWMAECEGARELFAQQINANVNEIAIVSSVSHAASAIATSIKPNGRRNKVVITDFDFPTIGHVWRSAEDEFEISFLRQNESGFNTLKDYETALSDDLLLFSTSHVNYYNGYKQNLKEISSCVHKKGGYLFVDAYQSFGQTPIDVKDMEIDFLAAGMQKYGLGIPGIAFLYVNEKIANELTPKITGWFGQVNPFAFDVRGKEYADGARRFDSGTFAMINGYAAHAALKILNGLDMKLVEKHLEVLSDVAKQEIQKTGLESRSQFQLTEKGSTTAVFFTNASEVEQSLAKEGIILSARNDVIRIAPHYYNTEEDVKTAIQALAKQLK